MKHLLGSLVITGVVLMGPAGPSMADDFGRGWCAGQKAAALTNQQARKQWREALGLPVFPTPPLPPARTRRHTPTPLGS